MIHFIFIGNVIKSTSTFVEQENVSLITNRCVELGLGGVMLYAEGNYLMILEGERENALYMFNRFKDHPLMDTPILMAEEPVETRIFNDFKLSFRHRDMKDPVETPVFLTQSQFDILIPSESPPIMKSMAKSFFTVQRVD